MRTKFKSWAKPLLDAHPEIVFSADSFPAIKKGQKIVLEIGCGKGNFIIEMAKKYPDYVFVAVEVNVSVAGIALKKILESELHNVFLYQTDVAKLFEIWKKNSFDFIFLNFSDPWPKKKHEKRRLTSSLYLKGIKNILKDDGELAIKTDNPDFYAFSMLSLQQELFKIVSLSENYLDIIDFDAQTEYETNFRLEGKPIYRIVCKKE